MGNAKRHPKPPILSLPRVMPGNINICFSFEAAVVLCSEESKRVGGADCGEYGLQTGYYRVQICLNGL